MSRWPLVSLLAFVLLPLLGCAHEKSAEPAREEASSSGSASRSANPVNERNVPFGSLRRSRDGDDRKVLQDETILVAGPAGKPDFGRDVQPLLSKYCVDCHSGKKPKGNLTLDGFADQTAALKNAKVWEKVADILRSATCRRRGQAAADRRRAGRAQRAGSTPSSSRSTAPARKTPAASPSAGSTAPSTTTPSATCVGVDFRPADDFPADDVGYGFDNIGDVLSLPPLLWRSTSPPPRRSSTRRSTTPDAAQAHPDARREAARTRRRRAPQPPAASPSRACRRPATDDEVRPPAAASSSWPQQNGDAPRRACKLALAGRARLAALPLPRRARPQATTATAPHPISDYELASRLSYFLWSSMPDDELFRLAARRQAAQARRARSPGQADAQGPEGARPGRELRRPVAADRAT